MLDGQSRMRVVLEPTVEVVVMGLVVVVGAAVIGPWVAFVEVALCPADVVLALEEVFFFDARLPPTPPPTAAPTTMRIATATRI